MKSSTIRWGRVADIALATWFVTLSLMRLTVLWSDRGADMRLYLAGTREWLAGGDPWSVHFGSFHFAAAPPSLLPVVPFALMPEPVAMALLTVLAVVASFWTLRKLGLPWWWIAWPPLVDNLWNGNPQIFLVPLLLGPVAWLAPIVKAYAVVPLLIQWRWKTLAMTVLVGLLTLPILPWAAFFGHLSTTTDLLSEQSHGGMSAWIFPILVPFTLVALVAMGRQRASWWFVPAVWPSTQWYYSLMAMPGPDADHRRDPRGAGAGRSRGRGDRRRHRGLVHPPPGRQGAGRGRRAARGRDRGGHGHRGATRVAHPDAPVPGGTGFARFGGDTGTVRRYRSGVSSRVRLILLALGVGWAVAVLVTLTSMGNPVDALVLLRLRPVQRVGSRGLLPVQPAAGVS